MSETNGSNEAKTISVDALVVGAGFGGLYSVYKLRQLGLSVHLLEAGSTLGGTWHWNSYPGARVDSEFPTYQLSIQEVYKTWTWSERFPGFAELRKYFEHVDKVLNISKDTTFNAEVVEAHFDRPASRWNVKTKQGHTATAQWLILCTGSTYKRHYPDFPGMDKYRGTLHHSGLWPVQGVNVTGKSIGIIGAGATGVQVVQELTKEAKASTVFIRTPNNAIPMKQRKLNLAEQDALKGFYDSILRVSARNSFGGFPYNAPKTPSASSVSAEEREALYEELYERGGFNLVGGIWADYMFDPTSNRYLYDFWAKKTRARITDPVKRDILAPLEPVHPVMTKRPSLEQDYYECLDKPNVNLVDLNKTPIEAFTESGIKTGDGKQHDFDLVVLATGFDNYTGAFSTMGLKDSNGTDLKDRWKEGVTTYCGLTVSGYPNMFVSLLHSSNFRPTIPFLSSLPRLHDHDTIPTHPFPCLI